MSRPPRVLMPVFNEIDYDGRVQRAAEAVGTRCDVTVMAIRSGHMFAPSGYAVRTIALPGGPAARLTRHLVFWAALLWIALRTRPRVVHAHDFFLAFPGWFAARLCGARLVYDAHELIIPEPGVRRSRRDVLFYRLEAWVVRRADLVIAANAARARLMAQHYGLATLPLAVENVPPQPASVLSDAEVEALYPGCAFAASATTLVYQGDMSLERGVGAFVDAMPMMGAGFRLLVIGGGPDLEALRARAEARSADITFAGRVPRAHLYDLMRRCDVGIVTYPTAGLNNIYCASNKVFEYLQAGLGLLSTCQPPLREIVSAYHVGVLVGCGGTATPQEIAAAVQDLVSDLPGARRRGRSVLDAYSWQREEAKLRSAYEGLLGASAVDAHRG